MCKRVLKQQTHVSGDVPFYTIGTFGKTSTSFIEQSLYSDFISKHPFPKKGDILISAAGTIGRLVVYDGKPAYFQDSNIVWIDNDQKKVSNKFLLYCYRNIRWQTEDTTIARLYNNNIRNTKLSSPALPEQQKIADFLGSVDAWLDNLHQQKNALETYKRGMMQKLFTQQVRFKDENGKDFPEWEEKALADISSKSNTGLAAGSLDGNEGEYPVYGASGLYKNIDFYQEEKPYIAIIKDGSGVGRTSIYPGKSSVIGTLNVIKPEAGMDPYFLYMLVSQLNLLKYVIGGAIPHIYYKDYRREKVMVPVLGEQQKIADFLTALDETIEAKEDEITKVEQWKKGLMQKMFV
jgi:type I restriction enzyme S subunit